VYDPERLEIGCTQVERYDEKGARSVYLLSVSAS